MLSKHGRQWGKEWQRKGMQIYTKDCHTHPSTPPASTSVWADRVSAIVSSLYIATGVLYCLLTILLTGGPFDYGLEKVLKLLIQVWNNWKTHSKWSRCGVMSSANCSRILSRLCMQRGLCKHVNTGRCWDRWCQWCDWRFPGRTTPKI